MAIFTAALGITGNVTSILLLLSPMPTFWVIVKRKTTGCYSAQPYLFGLLSSMLWSYYGCLQIEQGGFLVLITISAISCAFYSLYLFCYLFYASKSQREKSGWFLLAIVGFFTSTVIASMKFLHDNEAIMAVGLLCTVVSGFSNAAPLSIMRRVVKTKSVQYMPLSLSICLFLNGVTWLAYAMCLKDLYLIVTNGLAVSLAMLQLGLYAFYRFYGARLQQVADETGLNMKVNPPLTTNDNAEMDVKICSGRASRTSSGVAGMDFNNIVDLPPKANEMCVASEQNTIKGSTLRKLPTPRGIAIGAHLILEEFPHSMA